MSKKKIIYLDQSLLSNIAKALDSETRGHARVIVEPFWLTAYQKLVNLVRRNVIVCPSSGFHKNESVLSGEQLNNAIKSVYKSLSAGVTFKDFNYIARVQIGQHLINYLKDHVDSPLDMDPQRVVHGKLDESVRSWVSAEFPVSIEEIEAIKRDRQNINSTMRTLFVGWKAEKISFLEVAQKEANSFGPSVLKARAEFIKRREVFKKEVWQTEKEISLDDLDNINPPPITKIIDDVCAELNSRKVSDPGAEMIKYLTQADMRQVPAINIMSLLYAGLARKAALGQKKLPDEGTFVDVNYIASYLPYCDALFVDNKMASLIKEFPKTEREKYQALIFSANSKNEFLQYLDSIS